MLYIILILLIGVHLSPILLPIADMWHAQGAWVQTLILIMYATTFIQKPINSVRNIPLSLLTLWIGLSTAFILFSFQFKNSVNVTVLQSFFNFVCILIFYSIVTSYANKNLVKKCLMAIKYTILFEVLVSVFQFFNISQFFTPIRVSSPEHPWSMVVGMIGNGTHLSGLLGMTACLFFGNKRENYLALVLILILMMFTGSTLGQPAISGYIVMFCCALFYFWHRNRVVFYCLLVVPFAVLLLPISQQFFSMNGRADLWRYYFNMFLQQNQEVTGVGIGTVNAISRQTAFPLASHVHNEYLEYLFETGIIGIIFIFGVIVHLLNTNVSSDESLACKTISIGFLISCFFNFTSHLWMPVIIAVFAYASYMALERGQSAYTN